MADYTIASLCPYFRLSSAVYRKAFQHEFLKNVKISDWFEGVEIISSLNNRI